MSLLALGQVVRLLLQDWLSLATKYSCSKLAVMRPTPRSTMYQLFTQSLLSMSL